MTGPNVEPQSSEVARKLGLPVDNSPLSAYRDCSFTSCAPTRSTGSARGSSSASPQSQIRILMENAGLTRIEFSAQTPCRRAVGFAGAAPQDH